MTGLVTNIQGYSIHDGPGIRTVVFFKGCGLECRWCSNPECISANAEVGFIKNLCTKCGKCSGVCPDDALDYQEGKYPGIDRRRCNGCSICSMACVYKALITYGQLMNAEEIFDVVKRDKMFYEASSGGVTVSGGEALLQPLMVAALFEKCRQEGIHTCVETSGYAAESAFQQVLPLTDYVLFDLKLMNPDKHQQYTGKPNNLILSNAKLVAKSGVVTLYRMPLIPGINDDAQNIKDTSEFLKGLGNNTRLELMPYHRLGKGKYESLGKKYLLPDVPIPEQEYLESIKKAFELKGLICTISK